MGAIWLELAGIVFLIALNGFFSASEVAILASRKSKMQELAADGNVMAALVLRFQERPERFLATVHIGGVFSVILASGLAGVVAFQQLVPALRQSSIAWIASGSPAIALALVVLITGLLVVVFGSLVPRSLGLRYSTFVALRVAPIVRLFAILFRYPAILLTATSNAVLKIFRDRTNFAEARISEEEFKLMLEEGQRSGVIDKTEHELIESIFEFTDTAAREVMIPRPDIVAIDAAASREKIIKIVLEEGYSRMPVYRDTIDNIVGVVYSKDFLSLLELGGLIILEDILRPAYFVPETKKISQIMRELQQQKLHMAIVIDEFGGTAGVITMEDILEEIVGEIHDEYDEEVRDVEQAVDGSFLVNGRMAIRDFNDRFHVELPQADEYETVSGLLFKLTGRIPEINEEVTYNNLRFSVVKKSQRRIRLVKVRRQEPAAPPAAQE